MMRRRSILGAAAVVVLPVAQVVASAPHPDVVLLDACAEHARRIHQLNVLHEGTDEDGCPVWAAYTQACDAIGAARPHTMDGLLAKIGAAKLEAIEPSGREDPAHTPAAGWAWDTVNDLIRLRAAGIVA